MNHLQLGGGFNPIQKNIRHIGIIFPDLRVKMKNNAWVATTKAN